MVGVCIFEVATSFVYCVLLIFHVLSGSFHVVRSPGAISCLGIGCEWQDIVDKQSITFNESFR